MNAKRPTTVTTAAVLLALLSLLSVVSPLIPAFTDGVPTKLTPPAHEQGRRS